jgi:nicotinate-nucleotide adenylyltransferase
MKIGLYFGSFNPIHIGHLIIARHLLDNSSLEQVWFVVSPQNPLKSQASLLNEYQRLHLVSLSIDGENRLKASNIEFNLPKPSFTIDTLTYLEEKYPDQDYAIIMGSDSYVNLDKWKRGELIKERYELYVYERRGFPINRLTGTNRLHFVDAPLLDISASYIRKQIKAGKSIRYLVTDAVHDEILKAGYYR